MRGHFWGGVATPFRPDQPGGKRQVQLADYGHGDTGRSPGTGSINLAVAADTEGLLLHVSVLRDICVELTTSVNASTR